VSTQFWPEQLLFPSSWDAGCWTPRGRLPRKEARPPRVSLLRLRKPGTMETRSSARFESRAKRHQGPRLREGRDRSDASARTARRAHSRGSALLLPSLPSPPCASRRRRARTQEVPGGDEGWRTPPLRRADAQRSSSKGGQERPPLPASARGSLISRAKAPPPASPAPSPVALGLVVQLLGGGRRAPP
jgi:hypothetical protein